MAHRHNSRRPLHAALLMWIGTFGVSATAEIDQFALKSLFGYARGNPDTSLQDQYIVHTVSEPESVYASKPVQRSGPVWTLPLGVTLDPSSVKYTYKGKSQTLADYLDKTRTTGLLVIHDGKVIFERYQYERKPNQRYLSFSMSKSITGLLVGLALEDGSIRSLDDRVDAYLPELGGSAYAAVTIRQLLTMTSGVRWNDGVDGGTSDMRELNECHMRHRGCAGSLALLAAKREQEHGPATRFNYSGGDTMVLGHVLRAATKRDVAAYTQERLWGPLGAEDAAAWMVDRDGVENVFGHFAARMRDYGRLGVLLANQGLGNGRQLVSPKFLQEMTSAQFPATRPGTATGYFGYGYQLWLDPKPGVFCMRGLRGQAVYVDVSKKLVMVRLAVAKLGDRDDSPERDQLWHGLRAAVTDSGLALTPEALSARPRIEVPPPATRLAKDLDATTADDFGNDQRTQELLDELAKPRR